MLTPHAAQNIEKYTEAGLVGKAELARVGRLIRTHKSEIANSSSAAIVVKLDKPVTNQYREQWKESDLFVAIVRGSTLVTVMFSRSRQNNTKHYRTETIIQ